MERNLYISQLKDLLAQSAPEIVERHRDKYENILSGNKPIILFGAGRLGRTVLAGLRGAGVEPVAFSDNNPQLWGTEIDGVDVLSLIDAKRKFEFGVFVVAVYTAAPVRQQLKDNGLIEISFPELAWLFPDIFLPHGALECPNQIFDQSDRIVQAFDLWVDSTSQDEYLGQLRWRMSLDDSVLPPYLPQQEIYFSDVFVPSRDETFVDCGSFDGDTIREFIRRYPEFRSIIAIEPDHQNYLKLKNYIASLSPNLAKKISAVNYAVGPTRGVVQFNETGSAASSVGLGPLSVDCFPLDDILGGTPPTFIKMDIEGSESQALFGARKIIEKHAPVLAICLYHKQEHLWEIPLLLHSFNERYRFVLRRYSDQCWESVCYAIPFERLNF